MARRMSIVSVTWRDWADGAEETVKVELDAEDFAFENLDKWARSRFAVGKESKLRYLRKGMETGRFYISLY
jgi:hypothetical protein